MEKPREASRWRNRHTDTIVTVREVEDLNFEPRGLSRYVVVLDNGDRWNLFQFSPNWMPEDEEDC